MKIYLSYEEIFIMKIVLGLYREDLRFHLKHKRNIPTLKLVAKERRQVADKLLVKIKRLE